jgi:hypothetical protein
MVTDQAWEHLCGLIQALIQGLIFRPCMVHIHSCHRLVHLNFFS